MLTGCFYVNAKKVVILLCGIIYGGFKPVWHCDLVVKQLADVVDILMQCLDMIRSVAMFYLF